MGEIIGRAVSRKNALVILTDSQQYIPSDRVAAYIAALNRVRYEFGRHDPVKPKTVNGWAWCGSCGMEVRSSDVYCRNCGREIKRT